MLCLAMAACEQAAPAAPATVASPTRLDGHPLCGLTVPPKTDFPWRQYWRSFGREGGVSALLKDGNWLWVGTPYGLARLDLQTLDCTPFERVDADPVISLAEVQTLARDLSGCLWADNGRGGLARYCADDSVHGIGWQPLSSGHFGSRLAFDAAGNFWASSPVTRGMAASVHYDGHEPLVGGVWQSQGRKSRLSDDCASWSSTGRFLSPPECREQASWRRRLASLELPAGLELFESSPLATDEAGVWLFVRRGQSATGDLARYALLRFSDDGIGGGAWRVVPWPSMMTFDHQTFVQKTLLVADPDRGGVWIGSPAGLFFSDGRTLQEIPLIASTSLPVGPVVLGLIKDRAGRLWASADEGFFRLDEEADLWRPDLDGAHVRSALTMTLAVDGQNGVWVGSRRPPYLRYFPPATGDLEWREFPDYVAEPVHALLIDGRGDLWVGGEGPLWRYDGESWERVSAMTPILALGEDRQGRIWAGGQSGLYVYDPTGE
jgi:hypothetical protein